MATTQCKLGERLHQTKTHSPATADFSDDEVFWQQLMVIDYLMFEAIDAMDQERTAANPTPINYHWQQFVHHLRLKKPKLGVCLDNLRDHFQAEQQGGAQ
ncbi:MAG: hypothetical protein P8Y42_23180 [Exilibacterium sp.]